MSFVKLPILIVVVLEALRFGTDGQKACSCYTFENGFTGRKNWQQANDSCIQNKKHLVVLETVQEWEFINQTMKDQTADKYNEWHIGLFKNLPTRNWTWLNGKPLTLDKWQPRDEPGKDDKYALMAKEFPLGSHGLFGGIKDGAYRGWICEEETDNCQGVCMHHEQVSTATSPPRHTTSAVSQRRSTSKATYDHTASTTPASAPSKSELTDDKNDSTPVIVAVSLGALLFLALIVLGIIVVMRRKKQRGKDAESPQKSSSKQLENQYESVNSVEAAKLLGTPDTNNAHPVTKEEPPKGECEYAMVNKANKKPKKGDLVYAQLADFDDTKDEVKAHKPATYEPTVYADVVPTDVFHKTGPDSSEPTYANVQSTGV